MGLANIIIIYRHQCFLVRRTFKIYSPSYSQICSTVLLTLAPMLQTTGQGPIIPGSLYILTVCTHPPTSASGKGQPRWLSGKGPLPTQETQETLVPSLGREILWRRKWQPTPVFLPGKSHGQRSLAGYSPWGARSQTCLKRLNTRRWQISVCSSYPRARFFSCFIWGFLFVSLLFRFHI